MNILLRGQLGNRLVRDVAPASGPFDSIRSLFQWRRHILRALPVCRLATGGGTALSERMPQDPTESSATMADEQHIVPLVDSTMLSASLWSDWYMTRGGLPT